MDGSIASAQHDLRLLAQRGMTLDAFPRMPADASGLRRSAVLILFGALDDTLADVPAAASATASPAATSAPAAPVAPAAPAALDVLLTRRADHMRHHPGQIAFPGGGEEPEDLGDPVLAALREAHEETGLDPAGVEVLGTLPEVNVAVSNNLVTPVLGWWRLPSTVAADHSESVSVFRAPVAELLDPANRGTSVLRRDGYVHRGEAFRLHPRFENRIVWGFTGMLLSRMFDDLGWAVPWDATREFAV